MYANIILNDCSAARHLPFLVWNGIRAITGRLQPQNCQLLSPKMLPVLGRRLLALMFNYSGRGTYTQATPGLMNAWNFESRSSTIVSFIYQGRRNSPGCPGIGLGTFPIHHSAVHMRMQFQVL